MKEETKKPLIGLMLAGVIVVACFVSVLYLQPTNPRLQSSYEVKNFNSYQELTGYLNEFTANRGSTSSQSGLGAPNAHMETNAIAIDSMVGKSTEGGTPVDYSATNVQVAGVDEPDIVKTDGTYLYIVSQNRIIIVKTYPAEDANIVATITGDQNRTIQNIFISGTRLVVFAQSYQYYPLLYNGGLKSLGESSIISPWYDSQNTYITIYSLDTLSTPEQVKEIVVGGYFSGARLIGDYIYVITTQYTYNTAGNGENFTIVPTLVVNGEPVNVPLSNIYYVDVPEKSNTLTNIVSVNIQNDTEEIHEKIFLLGTSQTLYVSQENIYITYSNWYYYDYTALQKLIDDLLRPILPASVTAQLQAVDTLNITDYQKQEVITWILQNYAQNSMPAEEKASIVRQVIQETERTTIHRISIHEGNITYEAQGNVLGYIDNQFSLDEYNGYLRVSTTLQGSSVSYLFGSIEPETNLYVLDEDLKITGSLENITPGTGERIYATRFIGDKCYMVTFRQMDPFFVIDLSDPFQPTVLGSLKIPGYSTYLHPYDETHIIGIGKDGSTVKIALYDVTDMNNPVELANYSINDNESSWWTDSSALYEHKAFLFNKEKHLLVIPAGNWARQSAYVFDISVENGIIFKGNISHDLNVKPPEGVTIYDSYSYDYGNTIQRTLYIGNVLYTVSTNMVKMNDLDTLSEINSIALVETA